VSIAYTCWAWCEYLCLCIRILPENIGSVKYNIPSLFGFLGEAGSINEAASADSEGAQVSVVNGVASSASVAVDWEGGASLWEGVEAAGKDEGGRMKDESDTGAAVALEPIGSAGVSPSRSSVSRASSGSWESSIF
jgi:hypothetical protein